MIAVHGRSQRLAVVIDSADRRIYRLDFDVDSDDVCRRSSA